MTGHARRERGKAGESRSLHRRVAIPAVDAVVADVMLMTEGHGLIDRRKHRCIRTRVNSIRDDGEHDGRNRTGRDEPQNERYVTAWKRFAPPRCRRSFTWCVPLDRN